MYNENLSAFESHLHVRAHEGKSQVLTGQWGNHTGQWLQLLPRDQQDTFIEGLQIANLQCQFFLSSHWKYLNNQNRLRHL